MLPVEVSAYRLAAYTISHIRLTVKTIFRTRFIDKSLLLSLGMLFVLVWLCLIYACLCASALSGRAEEALFWLLKPACWLRHKPKASVQSERREKYVHIKILPIYNSFIISK